MNIDYDEETINVFDRDLEPEEFLLIQEMSQRILKEQRINHEYTGFRLQIFYTTDEEREDADE